MASKFDWREDANVKKLGADMQRQADVLGRERNQIGTAMSEQHLKIATARGELDRIQAQAVNGLTPAMVTESSHAAQRLQIAESEQATLRDRLADLAKREAALLTHPAVAAIIEAKRKAARLLLRDYRAQRADVLAKLHDAQRSLHALLDVSDEVRDFFPPIIGNHSDGSARISIGSILTGGHLRNEANGLAILISRLERDADEEAQRTEEHWTL